ncbi:DUF6005 family protein [Paenibacillus kobensis]|uniref:DUF6005 family protein n=1 Tax=Paenibacillus kobensis TaxID=59841 RepID=UPI000FD7D9D8|nr:DUF6005 family protein [Paenibacillus kobensis]
MKQAHCFLNGLGYGLEQAGWDERPLYIGAWDAPFSVTEEGKLSYYSADIMPSEYLRLFTRLYGEGAVEWYDYRNGKLDNLKMFLEVLRRNQDLPVLVQLDLFHMPYQKRTFQTMHQPHFVIVHGIRGDQFVVYDRYFGWEGLVAMSQVQDAFLSNELGGGLLLHPEWLHAPDSSEVAKIFEETIETDPGERSLTGMVRRRVMQTVESPDIYPPGSLKDAFAQLGILSKRKYSYGLLYQYFSEALTQSAELYLERLEGFIRMWGALAFLAIRTSMPGRNGEIGLLVDKVEQLHRTEQQLKEELIDVYRRWKPRFANGA